MSAREPHPGKRSDFATAFELVDPLVRSQNAIDRYARRPKTGLRLKPHDRPPALAL
ncbi:MAG: hypothetical protein JNM60_06555 [Candidatus Competibacteraceae bacterium]|nr:hypothetical protein [Candidatus Competibacteraceae bacterium]